jgi:hypothetical protein
VTNAAARRMQASSTELDAFVARCYDQRPICWSHESATLAESREIVTQLVSRSALLLQR